LALLLPLQLVVDELRSGLVVPLNGVLMGSTIAATEHYWSLALQYDWTLPA
jgi:hypothetical protein